MDRIWRFAAIVVALVLVLGGLSTVVLARMVGDRCANSVSDQSPSPGGAYEAIVFDRSCGPGKNASTQVSVLPHGQSLSGTVANAYRYGHHTPIRVEWDSPNLLSIHYPPGARSVIEKGQVGFVRIRYVEDPSLR